MVAAAEYVKFCALNYEIDSTNPICLRQESPVNFFDTGEETLTLTAVVATLGREGCHHKNLGDMTYSATLTSPLRPCLSGVVQSGESALLFCIEYEVVASF